MRLLVPPASWGLGTCPDLEPPGPQASLVTAGLLKLLGSGDGRARAPAPAVLPALTVSGHKGAP